MPITFAPSITISFEKCSIYIVEAIFNSFSKSYMGIIQLFFRTHVHQMPTWSLDSSYSKMFENNAPTYESVFCKYCLLNHSKDIIHYALNSPESGFKFPLIPSLHLSLSLLYLLVRSFVMLCDFQHGHSYYHLLQTHFWENYITFILVFWIIPHHIFISFSCFIWCYLVSYQDILINFFFC